MITIAKNQNDCRSRWTARSNRHRAAITLSVCFMLAPPSVHAGDPRACEPAWSGDTAIQSSAGVLALEVFDDGAGPRLYAGAGSSLGGLVIRWEGEAWSVVPGSPVTNDVRSLRVFDDGRGPALYAAGEFASVGGQSIASIARWNGKDWSPLGSGISGFGLSMVVHDDGGGDGPSLYVGGTFAMAGGVSVNRIARWNGDVWSPLGVGTNGAVHALALYDDGSGPALIAGGSFTSAGGGAAHNVARWDGDSWAPLGAGVGNQVRALAVHDDGSGRGAQLYAGGFITAGAFPFIVQRWDGAVWTQVGAGFNGTIRTLASFDDGNGPALYVGGDFTQIVDGGTRVNTGRIARWDGAAWSPVGPGMNGSVGALVRFDEGGVPALAAGGDFATAGGTPAQSVARWVGCRGASAIPGDIDGDGAVNGADLAMLLGAWGSDDAAADLNGDGVVDAADLALLLGNWTG